METRSNPLRSIAADADGPRPTQPRSDSISPVQQVLETIQSCGPVGIRLLSLKTGIPLPSLIHSLNQLERTDFIELDPDSMLFSVREPLRKAQL